MSDIKLLLGHLTQREALSRLLMQGRLPASLLFAGPSGIGKSLVAKELAAKILCESQESKPCASCESCRLLANNSHPDFRLLDVAREGLSTESLREFLYEQNLSSFGKGSKVSIINDADDISLVAANVLLKTLEEPRPHSYFILIAANPRRLPWPVLSRCQMWYFSALSQTEVSEILSQAPHRKALNDTNPQDAAFLFEGSLEGMEEAQEMQADWNELEPVLHTISRGDSGAGLALASRFAKEKDKLHEHLRLLRIFLRSELKKSGDTNRRLRLAETLHNTVEASRLIGDRNLAPLSVLNLIFLSLAGAQGAHHLILDELVI